MVAVINAARARSRSILVQRGESSPTLVEPWRRRALWKDVDWQRSMAWLKVSSTALHLRQSLASSKVDHEGGGRELAFLCSHLMDAAGDEFPQGH